MLIREEFFQFILLDDLSAESIANHIITCVARLELDIKNCVGQGYDGTASMSSRVSGGSDTDSRKGVYSKQRALC